MSGSDHTCCPDGSCPRHVSRNGARTLDTTAKGDRVRVVRVHGGRRLVHRLTALGIVPGSLITVARPRGPAIISTGGARIDVGRQAAEAVEVESAET